MLPRLPEGVADLVYFDPPFGTGRIFPGYDDRPKELSRRRETETDPRVLPVHRSLQLAVELRHSKRAFIDVRSRAFTISGRLRKSVSHTRTTSNPHAWR